jgi:hypothetical protein
MPHAAYRLVQDAFSQKPSPVIQNKASSTSANQIYNNQIHSLPQRRAGN